MLADVTVLTTLSRERVQRGCEVVKYGLIGDAPFFAWLEENSAEIFSASGPARRQAVETSARAKALIVAEDEREESGRRALLNRPHFRPRAEAYAGYSDRLLHGEADRHRHAACLRLFGRAWTLPRGRCGPGRPTPRFREPAHGNRLQIPGPRPAPDALLRLMAQDKKVKAAGSRSFSRAGWDRSSSSATSPCRG